MKVMPDTNTGLMYQYSISSIRQALAGVCNDPRINRVVLFGSYVNGKARSNSDIDLYLDSSKQITGFDFFTLKANIEDMLERDIDLLPDIDIEPGSLIAQEIEKYGVTVYAK